MIVPTAYTWTVGELVSAAKLNLYLRDAIAFSLSTPHARLAHSIGQSIPNNLATAMQFDTEEADVDNGHSTTTNPSRYIAQTAGVYQVEAVASWPSNTAGKRHVDLMVNGVKIYAASSNPATLSTPLNTHVAWPIPLSVGDYVEARAFQDSGGALSLSLSNGGSRMAVTWFRTNP